MEYYECGYYHGNNRWSGHRFATESPSQQPSRPTTLPPSDPEPVTQNEPEPKPEPVTQNEPEPEPEPTTTTPAPSTPSPTEDSDDDDDDSDDSEDDDDDDDETVVTPPRPVLCGNSWTGAGACIHTESQPAETHTGQPVVQGIPTGAATEQPPNGMPQATSAPELAATRRTQSASKETAAVAQPNPAAPNQWHN